VLLKIQRDGGLSFPLDTDVIKFVIFVSTPDRLNSIVDTSCCY
jgi:hypothetical protein